MPCVADVAYRVERLNGHGVIVRLCCMTPHCRFAVDVVALHKSGDKSGAGRYCRARGVMVKHWHRMHGYGWGRVRRAALYFGWPNDYGDAGTVKAAAALRFTRNFGPSL